MGWSWDRVEIERWSNWMRKPVDGLGDRRRWAGASGSPEDENYGSLNLDSIDGCRGHRRSPRSSRYWGFDPTDRWMMSRLDWSSNSRPVWRHPQVPNDVDDGCYPLGMGILRRKGYWREYVDLTWAQQVFFWYCEGDGSRLKSPRDWVILGGRNEWMMTDNRWSDDELEQRI